MIRKPVIISKIIAKITIPAPFHPPKSVWLATDHDAQIIQSAKGKINNCIECASIKPAISTMVIINKTRRLPTQVKAVMKAGKRSALPIRAITAWLTTGKARVSIIEMSAKDVRVEA